MFGLGDKALAVGLGVALALSVGTNVKQHFTITGLKSSNTTLERQINDPDTGYVARLATCKANTQALSGGIDRQNASIAANTARGAAAVADATRSVAAAQIKTAEAQRKASEIVGNQPSKGTVCDRLLILDKRLMGEIE